MPARVTTPWLSNENSHCQRWLQVKDYVLLLRKGGEKSNTTTRGVSNASEDLSIKEAGSSMYFGLNVGTRAKGRC